jgi:hypothetical protein
MLTKFPGEDGIAFISPPQSFDGGIEEEYDAHIGKADAGALRSGIGAIALARANARRPLKSIIEIGAGSGTCTMGLLAAAPHARFLITDTSPVFLRMIRRKLGAAGASNVNVSYATLAGEDLHKLDRASTDAIVIASALHHVSDWRLHRQRRARLTSGRCAGLTGADARGDAATRDNPGYRAGEGRRSNCRN